MLKKDGFYQFYWGCNRGGGEADHGKEGIVDIQVLDIEAIDEKVLGEQG